MIMETVLINNRIKKYVVNICVFSIDELIRLLNITRALVKTAVSAKRNWAFLVSLQ